MIVETFGPLAEARRRSARHWLAVFFDSEFFVDPTPGIAVNFASSKKTRTLGVSFIRTMPTLN
jgi:hypothetical protein